MRFTNEKKENIHFSDLKLRRPIISVELRSVETAEICTETISKLTLIS